MKIHGTILTAFAILAQCSGLAFAAEPQAKPLAARKAAAEKRFAEIRPEIRVPMADVIVTNFSYLKMVMSGEKLFEFDKGMITATAAQHQDKPGCKGLAEGLLCEIDAQMDEALAEVNPQKAGPPKADCAKTPNAPECDPNKALQNAMKALDALKKK